MEVIKDLRGNEVVLMGPHDRLEVLTDVSGESMTKQSFKDECDINVIMARYERSGQLPLSDDVRAEFGDFSDSLSFHEASNRIIAAQDAFMRVPAHIRAEFGNDPGRFLEFAIDPKNLDRMVELGLAVKRPPAKSEVVSTTETVAEPAKPA